MRLATVRDIELPGHRRMRIREHAGDGTPVVMLHGLLDSSEGWDEVAARSARRCLAFDLPGFGGSTPPRYERVASYARDIEHALDELGLERYVLVGHSFGGAIATALCEQRPDAAAALILIAPVGFGRIPLAELGSRVGIRQLFQASLPVMLSNPLTVGAIYSIWVANGCRPDRALIDRLRHDAFRCIPGVRQALRTIVQSGIDERAFFRRELDYDGPVVALWGDHDRLVPVRHAPRVLTTFPHADVQVWQQMGHHPQRERSGPFCALIERICGVADGVGERVTAPAVAAA